jgi:hypothetical protein
VISGEQIIEEQLRKKSSANTSKIGGKKTKIEVLDDER